MDSFARYFKWMRRERYRIEPVEYLEQLANRYENSLVGLQNEYQERMQARPLRHHYDLEIEIDALRAKRDAARKFLDDFTAGQRAGEWTDTHQPWDHTILVSDGPVIEYATDENIAEAMVALIGNAPSVAAPFRDRSMAGALSIPDIALPLSESFGPLRFNHASPHDPNYDWQPVRDWYSLTTNLQQWLHDAHWRTTEGSQPAPAIDFNKFPGVDGNYKRDRTVGEVEVRLRYRAQGKRPEMILVPTDLFSLIGVQFAELSTGQTQLSNCAECGRPFFHGGSSARRQGSLYCDDTCREKHKIRKRTEVRRAQQRRVKPKRKANRSSRAS